MDEPSTSTSPSPNKKIEKIVKSPDTKINKSTKSKIDASMDHSYAEKHPFEKVKVRREEISIDSMANSNKFLFFIEKRSN